ncbi:carbohydrate-binding domain-containing protein [Roseomonas chloroacetimidivorans]|uniref:carbohydrate-binding domain-containing protein n=1 Tax=Roseomonas chloroacetimidivorans TaxID=1766656 RepID=UPI003C764CDD
MSSSATAPTRVSTFVDSLGINVHMGYFDTPYGDVSSVVSKLDYLGLHHVRDGASWSGWVPPLVELGKAGIKLDMMVGDRGESLDQQFANLTKLAPYIATIEGPNEVNFSSITYNGQTGVNAVVAQQAAINQRLEGIAALKDKPLVGFSVAASADSGFTRYGDNSAANDYGNAHVYFPAGTPPAGDLAKYVAMANLLTPSDRMFLTETGLPTNAGGPGNQGVSETVQAKYTLNLLLDAHQQGIARTFLYELQDEFADPQNNDQEQHYGLFRNDGSAKPAAIALHNLTTILGDAASDAATFTTGTLNYTVSNLPSAGHHMLMQEANGNFDILLWNEPVIWDDSNSRDLTVAAQNVTVNLGGTFSTVNVYDPLVGERPVTTYHDVSSLVLGITDHPLIVKTVGTAGSAAVTAPVAAAVTTGRSLETTTVGSGADTLVLKFSEDAYRGDAQFTVSVDGKQVGGVMTVEANKGAGQYEQLEIKGDWATGNHQVAVTFLNDAWGGTADTDRNLYVESATLNGKALAAGALGTVNGTEGFSFAGTKALVAGMTETTTVGSGADTLVLKLSEDAYRGDAQFTVSVDGKQVGGVMTVEANKGAGQYEQLEIKGDWATGNHQVAVTFLNDAWGGTADTDRNLYVESATLNGKALAAGALGTVNGTESFSSFQEVPSKLVLHMAEDAWNGDAQFKLWVDGVQVGGVQTVTAIHSKQQVQDFAFEGAWNAGQHKVEIKFLNDAYGGTASTDRNLHVEAIDFGSMHYDVKAAMNSGGMTAFDHLLFA